MRKAQVWSMDLIVAVIIFMLAIGVFYFFTSTHANDDTSKLQVESQIVANKLAGDEAATSITKNNEIDEAKLRTLVDKEYGALKNDLGVQQDFCIVLEDENGNLIMVDNGSVGKYGVGSGDLNITVDGETHPCGEII